MPRSPAEPADLRLPVQRESDVPHAVAAARQFCLGHGAPALLAATVATVASELANNLRMHTRQGGELRLRLTEAPRRAIALWSLDDGPGIADVARALQDGFSTAGGLGCGLPGAQRLMDRFEIDSGPGRGTRIHALKWLPPRPAPAR